MSRKDCKVKNATYGLIDTKIRLFCATHKKDGMINVKSPRCLDCESQPFFNYEGQKKRNILCYT